MIIPNCYKLLHIHESLYIIKIISPGIVGFNVTLQGQIDYYIVLNRNKIAFCFLTSSERRGNMPDLWTHVLYEDGVRDGSIMINKPILG